MAAFGWGEPVREPLSLEECLRIAAERSLSLAASREQLKAAESSAREARSARYPRLDLEGGYFRLQSPPSIAVLDEEVPLGRPDAFFIGLNARQRFYSGGAIQAGIQAAENAFRAAEEVHRAELQRIGLRVHEAFYGVVLAKALLEIRNASREQIEAHLEQAQARFRRGAASEFELLRAEVELANHRPLVIAAEHRLAGAREELTRLLGGDLAEPVDAGGELTFEPWEGSVEDAVDAALSRRAELDAAESRVASMRSAVSIARAGKKPNLSWFSALFGSSPEYFLASDRSFQLNWMGGVAVGFPLFHGFETESRIDRARAELRRTEILRADLELGIRLEVRKAHRRLEEAESTIEAQARVLEQAERALSIARVRYASGLGTQLELNDARLAFARARLVRLEAVYAHIVARAALRRAVGISLFPPEVQP